MPDDDPIILLTRPAKQAVEFRKLLGTGVDVVESPVIKIRFLRIQQNPEEYSGVIFTSQNAVEGAASMSFGAGQSAFAVGDKTAEASRAIGLPTLSANGNADKLVKLIISNVSSGRLLLIHGKFTTGDIENRLKMSGIEIDSAVVYEQVPMPLGSDAIFALRGERPVVLPLFSARSAAILSEAANAAKATAPLILAAISKPVLDAWVGPPPVAQGIAEAPTASEMATEILRRINRTS